MYEFQNAFTGETFVGTVDQLFFRLEGKHETIFDKSDVVKTYGWSWDSSRMTIR